MKLLFFTIVWSAVATFIIVKIISIFTSIRVEDRAEAIGLDDSEHEETAPNFHGIGLYSNVWLSNKKLS